MTQATESVADAALQKEETLTDLLRSYGSIVIAYSGGVDSTYLADVAHDALGANARMVVADSPSIPRTELAEAIGIAHERNWSLTVIYSQEFEMETYLENGPRRCYFCKGEIFSKMRQYADENRIPVLAYGETADDVFDATRYGKLAAKEHAVVAPLQEAGLKKEDIRQLSRRRGLPTWNKASFACLASRFPSGTRINAADMAKIERAEELLKSLGFHQYRARHHGDLCRIEIDVTDFEKIIEPQLRAKILSEMKAIGYRHVTLDLAGYRTGSTAQ